MEIKNETPWSTEEITTFLAKTLGDKLPPKITIDTLRAHPGTRKADQQLFAIRMPRVSGGPVHLTLYLLSPKRAAARTETLERLALATSLEPHEAVLSASVLENIAHALLTSVGLAGNRSRPWRCETGQCDCDTQLGHYPVIRGDTKVRTTKPVSLKRLKQRLGWARKSAAKHEERAAEEHKKANRLAERIAKLEAKGHK